MQIRHHDWLGILEESGLVEFTKVEVDANGIYRANLVINGDYVKEPKTFFPKDWSRKKVVEKIIESLKNLVNEPELRANGKWRITGKTTEGIHIRTIINPIKNKIETSYPIFETE